MRKFKDWVTALLLCTWLIFWFLIFADGFILNWIGIIGTLLCVVLLTKYSKICG